jgi:uncharacterized repeat protein (TIGR03803 family)
VRLVCMVFGCFLFAGCAQGTGGGSPFAPVARSASAVDSLGRSQLRVQSMLVPSGQSAFSILHSFNVHEQTGGYFPAAGLVALNGTLYGTTEDGGTYGYGTIFSITPSGKFTILYNFYGGSDGANPEATLIAVNGALYGTASAAGEGYGTVFEFEPSAGFGVLYHFAGGMDGADPAAALTYANGTLYGTTKSGGTGTACTNGCGTVFSLALNSIQDDVVYSFQGGADGWFPEAAVIDVDGTLYGTTAFGGIDDNGTVFRVTTSGNEAVIYRFKGGSADGSDPEAPLTDLGGTLYGTTFGGGNGSCADGRTCGSIYSVTTSGSEKILHLFDGNDGSMPAAGFIYVNGSLYSTTNGDESTCGTVFKTNASGKVIVLHRFAGHGCAPVAGLEYSNGAFYGTTTGYVAEAYYTVNGGAVFKYLP